MTPDEIPAKSPEQGPAATPDAPTLYDVLGVERSATPAAVRKAWRRRTDKAGPGSPEFARLNEAADTLLDPVRRQHYDTTLPPEPEPEPVPKTGHTRPALPWLVGIGVLALVTAGVLALAVVLTVRHHHQDQAETARTEAPAAAERALPVVLGYDYRHLDADLRNASAYLTPAYRKQFQRTFALLEDGKDGQPGPAVQTKTVVTASVVGTAVMDADPDRVQVLAYVNQISKHGTQSPNLFQNRVRVSMVKSGHSWLIDGLDPR
jgi:Mce-associated membrane protein